MSKIQKLQIKIFTRWTCQKLNPRKIVLQDCTKELDGVTLVALLELLSEQKYPKKMRLGKMKMQKIDNLNQALNWSFKKLGVVMKLKPSPENFLEGRVSAVLGYLWTLFLKYTVIGDEDEEEKEQLSAEDSLLMWIKNQVKDYKNVDVQNMTKSFHNGLALCALVHKFRPKLIDYESLNANNSKKNLQTAFDAAEKFFGLEQYLKPEDLSILTKKEMMIYLSEYYYGIAELRKSDLAARRINKLIKFTETNDKMKIEYTKRSAELNTKLDQFIKFLSDKTIDNTYEGAKKKAERFTKYKTVEKGDIGGQFLSLETYFNHIAMRLSDHNRPEFKAETNSLEELQDKLKEIEKLEKEQTMAIHAELNRQEKLRKWNDIHEKNAKKILEWTKKQQIYLKENKDITSSSFAKFEINKLEGYRMECANIKNEAGKQLTELGKQLEAELYQFTEKVKQRQKDVAAAFDELDRLADAKEPVLKDHLARNQYREAVLLEDTQHIDKHGKLSAWVVERKAFLTKKENITSVSDAELHLSLLEAYGKEKKGYSDINVVSLTDLGKKILASEYKTDISAWQYETPDKLKAREQEIHDEWIALDKLSDAKLLVLQDDLAREKYKAQVLLWNSSHVTNIETLVAWIKEKRAYLNKKEEITCTSDATQQLDKIDAYVKEKKGLTDVNIVSVKTLGQQIINAEYKTELSQYKFETPNEVLEREAGVDKDWVELDGLYKVKLAILEDDLAREKFKDMLRLKDKQHKFKWNALLAWQAEKEAYLKIKEVINSIKDAETQLGLLEVYKSEKKDKTDSNVVGLKDLGKFILDAEYKTELSNWRWETPQEIKDREGKIDTLWETLDKLYVVKLAILEDDLAREKFRENLRLLNGVHINNYNKLNDWADIKSKYLLTKENTEITAFAAFVQMASSSLAQIASYKAEKHSLTQSTVTAWKELGKSILDAEYKTELSQFKFATPEEITTREEKIDEYWVTLEKQYAEKKTVLDDDLAREIYKEETLNLVGQHVAGWELFEKWNSAKNAYLKKKEEIDSIADAMGALEDLDAYVLEKKQMTKINCVKFRDLGQKVLDSKYESKISEWTYQERDLITDRHSKLADYWVELDKLSDHKNLILKDDLARETFREELRLKNEQHKTQTKSLTNWYDDKKAYLQTKEKVACIDDANKNLGVLAVYKQENGDVTESNVQSLKNIGNHILTAEYKSEYSTFVFATKPEIVEREKQIDALWVELDELHTKKLAVLEDDLAREKFREKLRLLNEQHISSYDEMNGWSKAKEEYLKKKEMVDSISLANEHLGLWRWYTKEKKNLLDKRFPIFQALGKSILDDEYKTELSQFKFKTPEEITDREKKLEDYFVTLDGLSATKKAILDDDLKRETFRAATLLLNQQHIAQHTILSLWIKEKNAYLKKKEDINSILDANEQLDSLASFDAEKKQLTKVNCVSFTTLGKKILSSKYESELSKWEFKTPEEIHEREKNVVVEFEELDSLYAKKLAVAEDDLAREEFKEALRLRNVQHITQFSSLSEWHAGKKQYLLHSDEVDSVPQALKNLGNLNVYKNEKKDITSSNVARFKGIGKHILEAEYKTEHSSYVFETPQEIKDREGKCDDMWVELDDLHAKKLAVLEDDLAREQFREALRLQNEQHIVSSNKLNVWSDKKKVYLNVREEIDSIADAQTNIGILTGYESEKKDLGVSDVFNWHKLGKEIQDAEYKTDLSQFKFKTPEEITKRQQDLEQYWSTLDDLNKKKSDWLDERLKVETEKEKLRLQYANIAGECSRWTVDTSERIGDYNFGFTLAEVQDYKKVLDTDNKALLAAAKDKQTAYEKAHGRLTEMKDTHIQNYTELTINDLGDLLKDFKDSVSKRSSAYDVELARHVQNDKLCRQFAVLSKEILDVVDKHKDTVTKSAEKLQDQLKFVEEHLESKQDGEKLPECKTLQGTMDERKIETNIHTVLNYHDVETQFNQYVQFLNTKSKMLKEEIEHTEMKGITKEQYQEIQKQFDEFDKDGTKILDKYEFKACLFSLGNEKPKKEIVAIMNEYGSEKEGIAYEGFKQFQIKELGDAGTKEEIMDSFSLLSGGRKFIEMQNIDQLLEDHDLDYLKTHCKPLDNGLDYGNWVEEAYAR